MEVVTQTQVAKGRKLLNELVQNNQISLEGKNWLTFALDPFHDREIKGVNGIPDGNTGKSVVCSIVQEITVKKNVGLPVGNWGCRIATYPVATKQTLSPGFALNNLASQFTPGIGSPFPIIAPVVVDQQLDGSDFNEFPLSVGATGSQWLEIPQQYTKGPYKIGAMGVEVVNTTSDLHRQGMVTCARMNQTSCEPAATQIFAGAIGSYAFVDCVPVRTAPVNLAQMVLLTGNTGWKAAEGAYSVVALKSINDKHATSKPVYPMMLSSDFISGDATTAIPAATPILTTIPAPGLNLPGNPALTQTLGFPGQVPMDTSVIMFTGLSEETTLTVRVRWMIERFPNDVESDIVVLANPTPAYDPIALSIYSQVMQQCPAAVMFKENPEGEWWKTVLGTIADVVGAGLMMVPHPVAKAAGGAILTANKAFNPDNSNVKVGVSSTGKPKPVQRKAAKKKAKGAKLLKGPPPKSGTVKI